jgi:hypothetical protein
MNVEIGAEAAQFPEKEYRNGIAVAVCIGLFYLFLYSKPLTNTLIFSLSLNISFKDEVTVMLLLHGVSFIPGPSMDGPA